MRPQERSKTFLDSIFPDYDGYFTINPLPPLSENYFSLYFKDTLNELAYKFELGVSGHDLFERLAKCTDPAQKIQLQFQIIKNAVIANQEAHKEENLQSIYDIPIKMSLIQFINDHPGYAYDLSGCDLSGCNSSWFTIHENTVLNNAELDGVVFDENIAFDYICGESKLVVTPKELWKAYQDVLLKKSIKKDRSNELLLDESLGSIGNRVFRLIQKAHAEPDSLAATAFRQALYNVRKAEIQRKIGDGEKRKYVIELLKLAEHWKLPKDLSGLNLRDADLSELGICGVDFRNSDLRDANFYNSTIDEKTDFRGADVAKITIGSETRSLNIRFSSTDGKHSVTRNFNGVGIIGLLKNAQEKPDSQLARDWHRDNIVSVRLELEVKSAIDGITLADLKVLLDMVDRHTDSDDLSNERLNKKLELVKNLRLADTLEHVFVDPYTNEKEIVKATQEQLLDFYSPAVARLYACEIIGTDPSAQQLAQCRAQRKVIFHYDNQFPRAWHAHFFNSAGIYEKKEIENGKDITNLNLVLSLMNEPNFSIKQYLPSLADMLAKIIPPDESVNESHWHELLKLFVQAQDDPERLRKLNKHPDYAFESILNSGGSLSAPRGSQEKVSAWQLEAEREYKKLTNDSPNPDLLQEPPPSAAAVSIGAQPAESAVAQPNETSGEITDEDPDEILEENAAVEDEAQPAPKLPSGKQKKFVAEAAGKGEAKRAQPIDEVIRQSAIVTFEYKSFVLEQSLSSQEAVPPAPIAAPSATPEAHYRWDQVKNTLTIIYPYVEMREPADRAAQIASMSATTTALLSKLKITNHNCAITHIIPEVDAVPKKENSHVCLRVVNQKKNENFQTCYENKKTSVVFDPRAFGLGAQNTFDDTNCGRYVSAMGIQAAGLAKDGLPITKENLKASPAVARALHFNSEEKALIGLKNAYVRPLSLNPSDEEKIKHYKQVLLCLKSEYEARSQFVDRDYHGTSIFGGYGTATFFTKLFGFSADEKLHAVRAIESMLSSEGARLYPSTLPAAARQGLLGESVTEISKAQERIAQKQQNSFKFK